VSVSSAPNAVYAFCAAFFEELVRSGVSHVCVSPGSRSTPLTISAARTDGLRAWSHLDERSAGFFALGLAKASRSPVALIATSGTAPANYLPAVIEASYAGVPLIVLSADRPPELREWGAGQTIDQLRLYGSHVRFFAELPIPDAGGPALRYARALACRASAEAQGRSPGPVHLNWPLREPLAPDEDEEARGVGWAEGDTLAESGRGPDALIPITRADAGEALPSIEEISSLVDLVRDSPRGLIVCGPQDDEPGLPEAIARLARLAGWPVWAEPTSQLRAGSHVQEAPILACGDWLVRSHSFAAKHSPQVVLRFGNTPVSKAYRVWLEAAPPQHLVLVDAAGAWNEPSHLASRLLAVDPLAFCEQLADSLDACGMEPRSSDWLESFVSAEEQVDHHLGVVLGAEPRLFEPRATRDLGKLLPGGALLYVSNSMPVRDLDAFMATRERGLRVMCNRGANGIDGMVSSALGAAAAGLGPVVLLTGDLALLHDIGGLLAARRYPLSATFVVLNNDGGGIFDHLPVARHGQSVRFEEFFATPHGLDLARAAALYQLEHIRVSSWQEYADALAKSLAGDGVTIIEVPVDRRENLEHFRELVAGVDSLLVGEGRGDDEVAGEDEVRGKGECE
jgi:2-succinyl-5-enolpyruvyl-6-hydroxy-3-cyclohexene-1-carboxylate synthase